MGLSDKVFSHFSSFPNLGIQHVTKKKVSQVLMERYLKMQTLHTATLNAMTADNSHFDVGALGDQATSDGDRSIFDKNLAEAIAGETKNDCQYYDKFAFWVNSLSCKETL